ncbi:RNA polymerase sigma factor [Paenibacillus paeoniae]|uniref:RNA polymerase sigma factor n=1 Tax=Paenibacillus paeoniae TaxID=2292705 RepID=A0A371PGG3_9BACL|nr:RNA polymerase sigma factor [Paenibacillus paeoniae]REK75043.1 RNA polymerase sigma factor [Paenibacillus paeoniae]
MKISSLVVHHNHVDNNQTDGMERAIPDVYDRHIDTVYRVCYSLMGNKQDAEDAAQSVFVKLMESGKPFADAEHEKAWLIVTARNHCRDLHRKWWKKKVVDLDPSTLELVGATPLESRELEDNLRKLPSSYRLILYLHYYEGYKVAEIAVMLKLNPNTVKSQMRSARKRLKLQMGDEGYE